MGSASGVVPRTGRPDKHSCLLAAPNTAQHAQGLCPCTNRLAGNTPNPVDLAHRREEWRRHARAFRLHSPPDPLPYPSLAARPFRSLPPSLPSPTTKACGTATRRCALRPPSLSSRSKHGRETIRGREEKRRDGVIDEKDLPVASLPLSSLPTLSPTFPCLPSPRSPLPPPHVSLPPSLSLSLSLSLPPSLLSPHYSLPLLLFPLRISPWPSPPPQRARTARSAALPLCHRSKRSPQALPRGQTRAPRRGSSHRTLVRARASQELAPGRTPDEQQPPKPAGDGVCPERGPTTP